MFTCFSLYLSAYLYVDLSAGHLCAVKACGEVCQGCRDVIADRFLLRVNSRSWHQTCLRCCVCQLALDRQPSCFIREHNVYCKTDYTR